MSTTQEDIEEILRGKPKLVHPLWSNVGAAYDGRIVEGPESGVWIPGAYWDALPARIEAAIDAAFEEGHKRGGWMAELDKRKARDIARVAGVSALKGKSDEADTQAG